MYSGSYSSARLVPLDIENLSSPETHGKESYKIQGRYYMRYCQQIPTNSGDFFEKELVTMIWPIKGYYHCVRTHITSLQSEMCESLSIHYECLIAQSIYRTLGYEIVILARKFECKLRRVWFPISTVSRAQKKWNKIFRLCQWHHENSFFSCWSLMSVQKIFDKSELHIQSLLLFITCANE